MGKQTVRDVALNILLKIEQNEAYSNQLINRAVEKNRFGVKDTALFTRLVYGTVQHRNTLDFYLDVFLKKDPEPWVRELLRLAVYQMAYLDRVPDRAVLHESVEIAKRRGHKGIASLVNGVLRTIQRKGLPKTDHIADPLQRLAVETSHPQWLLDRWISQYGRETVRRICEANNMPAKVTVRTNTMKTTRDELIDRLRDEGIEAISGKLAPEAIEIKKGVVQHTKSFTDGLVTIQDESSMLVAHALDVNEGMNVLDACAAPGGKTTHIAQLMNNTGGVIALDLHKHKVKLIEEQASRLGLTNVHAEALDSRKAGERFREASFDRILIDAPCSGMGVIRRKPDIKWGKSPDDIGRLAVVQTEILETLAPLLKPGGKLVYSTCTIDREENEEIIASFLRHHPQFFPDQTLANRLPEVFQPSMNPEDGQMQILPHYFGTDGFYIAVLRKEAEETMETAFQTDCGKIRTHNEDSGGVFQHQTGHTLAIVADGMGGHRAGDVASALTLEYIKDRWEEADGLDSGQAATNWLQKTIQEANTHVLSYADEHPECQGMGTTVVAALCTPEFVTIIHVGDSRCYFLGTDGFAQVTKDHSLVGELVRQGEISKEEAASHPRKHVILQALGTEETVKSDTNTIEWDVGDVILLCSDGLTDHVHDARLEEVLRSDTTIKEKAAILTDLANQAGGVDNITLALVQLTDENHAENHQENDSVLKNGSSPSSDKHSQTNIDGIGESSPAEEKSR